MIRTWYRENSCSQHTVWTQQLLLKLYLELISPDTQYDPKKSLAIETQAQEVLFVLLAHWGYDKPMQKLMVAAIRREITRLEFAQIEVFDTTYRFDNSEISSLVIPPHPAMAELEVTRRDYKSLF